ncbi:unnamed protein product, partial [Ectocarpus sp. 12 AP-2014]
PARNLAPPHRTSLGHLVGSARAAFVSPRKLKNPPPKCCYWGASSRYTAGLGLYDCTSPCPAHTLVVDTSIIVPPFFARFKRPLDRPLSFFPGCVKSSVYSPSWFTRFPYSCAPFLTAFGRGGRCAAGTLPSFPCPRLRRRCRPHC